jgi:hypothetical protein
MKTMKSIQEIFSGRFADARFATIERCDLTEKNIVARIAGYTAWWDPVGVQTDLIGIAIGDRNRREIWIGRLVDQVPDSGKFRLLVDKFELIGVHDQSEVTHAFFYGKGSGGSRVNVEHTSAVRQSAVAAKNVDGAVGQMVQRTVWLRKNHAKFRDPVWKHWGGKCAVTRSDCNSLLVASHIRPWSISSPTQKTDVHNGLLLAASIDALFDRGLVSFSNDGTMLFSSRLSPETAQIFGVRKGMKLDVGRLTNVMRGYLAWHREHFNFP